MWEAAKDLLKPWQDRKSSPNRSQIETNTIALIELDKKGSPIKFMTDTLSNVSRSNPEELNSFAVVKRLEMLEREMRKMEAVERLVFNQDSSQWFSVANGVK